MTPNRRRRMVRAAADLASAIRSGSPEAIDRSQQALARLERHRAAPGAGA